MQYIKWSGHLDPVFFIYSFCFTRHIHFETASMVFTLFNQGEYAVFCAVCEREANNSHTLHIPVSWYKMSINKFAGLWAPAYMTIAS